MPPPKEATAGAWDKRPLPRRPHPLRREATQPASPTPPPTGTGQPEEPAKSKEEKPPGLEKDMDDILEAARKRLGDLQVGSETTTKELAEQYENDRFKIDKDTYEQLLKTCWKYQQKPYNPDLSPAEQFRQQTEKDKARAAEQDIMDRMRARGGRYTLTENQLMILKLAMREEELKEQIRGAKEAIAKSEKDAEEEKQQTARRASDARRESIRRDKEQADAEKEDLRKKGEKQRKEWAKRRREDEQKIEEEEQRARERGTRTRAEQKNYDSYQDFLRRAKENSAKQKSKRAGNPYENWDQREPDDKSNEQTNANTEQKSKPAEKAYENWDQRKPAEKANENTNAYAEHKKKESLEAQWKQRWPQYQAAMDNYTSADSIPWPVWSGQISRVHKGNVDQFYCSCVPNQEERIAVLKKERKRWHPDMVQKKIGQMDKELLAKVNEVFQIVDTLYGDATQRETRSAGLTDK